MQKNTIQWAKWLVLPLLLAACGGSHSNENMAAENVEPKGSVVAPTEETTTNASTPEKAESPVVSETKTEESAPAPKLPVTKEAEKSTEVAEKNKPQPATEPKKEKVEPPKPKEEVVDLSKAEITPELVKEVITAKESHDNAGLPAEFEADYVITTTKGTETAKLRAPENSSNDPSDSTNYRFNGGLLFPEGESTGEMKSYLLAEDGKTRQPHTEETFMSYQQFYSGIAGSQKQIVYFDDERVERDEPFYFELPEGMLTENKQVPTVGEATYNGKAIDGSRFGDFSYTVDFANKVGKGGSIVWDKTKQGKLGDITLQAGKIGDQVLSVYSEPEIFPDEYSHRAPGITGVADIEGNTSDKKYQYTAVFFGPKAEELGGLVYEHDENATHSHSLLGGDVEKTNVTSFTGQR